MMEGESHSMNCERNQPHLLIDGALTGLRVISAVAGLGKQTHQNQWWSNEHGDSEWKVARYLL